MVGGLNPTLALPRDGQQRPSGPMLVLPLSLNADDMRPIPGAAGHVPLVIPALSNRLVHAAVHVGMPAAVPSSPWLLNVDTHSCQYAERRSRVDKHFRALFFFQAEDGIRDA